MHEIELHELLSLKNFLQVRPDGLCPLLVHQDGSFLSQYQFVAVFCLRLASECLHTPEYSSHSFRIGEATAAACWGMGSKMI